MSFLVQHSQGPWQRNQSPVICFLLFFSLCLLLLTASCSFLVSMPVLLTSHFSVLPQCPSLSHSLWIAECIVEVYILKFVMVYFCSKSWLEIGLEGWRDGSAVKSTDCSSEGCEFKSQQPHGGSQPSVMRSGASSGVSKDSYSILTYI
jgi:hypothetical protein